MGAKVAVSLEEYLGTNFPDLDREYRDGELVERSIPDYIHGKTQAILVALFIALRIKLPIFASVETRMRLRDGLVLIPDVSVFYQTEPDRLPTTPPLIVIEVLSIDDRMAQVRDKLEEYKAWGVPHVWLVDPHTKRFYTCDAGLREVAVLSVPELELEVAAEQVFL